MEIVYAAYTETGTFMLDERGVCRWAVAPPGKTHAAIPEKIVGAQYVATLDLASTGALVDLPRVGCPMLFAAVDETGRIQLVRTQPVTRFEDKRHPSAAPPPSSRAGGSVPPLPLVRPASAPPGLKPPASPLPPPRQSMIAPKMPPPPRAPSIASIPTPSAIRTVPPVLPPPRRTTPSIPPPPVTEPTPPPAMPSRPRGMGTNGLPSSSDVQSMPTRIKGSSTQMRRMIRGR